MNCDFFNIQVYQSKILALDRNPFYPKYFLTAGGNCSKIWCEAICKIMRSSAFLYLLWEKNEKFHTHKFPIGVSHKTPPCNTPHKKGGRSFLALLMKYLWLSPKTRQVGGTFEGLPGFTKPNLHTISVDQNFWSRF